LRKRTRPSQPYRETIYRLYEKAFRHDGTAETEAAEFQSTYKLDVIRYSDHMPMVRSDFSDVIYRTLPEKVGCGHREIKDATNAASRPWSVQFS